MGRTKSQLRLLASRVETGPAETDFLKKYTDNLFLLTVFTSVDRKALCTRYHYTYLYIFGPLSLEIEVHVYGMRYYRAALSKWCARQKMPLSHYLAPYRHSARTDGRTDGLRMLRLKR